MKDTKQITNSNFTSIVLEIEQLVRDGYSVVKEGENRPYNMIMGNYIVTLERDAAEKIVEQDQSPVTENSQKASATRGRKPKQQ